MEEQTPRYKQTQSPRNIRELSARDIREQSTMDKYEQSPRRTHEQPFRHNKGKKKSFRKNKRHIQHEYCYNSNYAAKRDYDQVMAYCKQQYDLNQFQIQQQYQYWEFQQQMNNLCRASNALSIRAPNHDVSMSSPIVIHSQNQPNSSLTYVVPIPNTVYCQNLCYRITLVPPFPLEKNFGTMHEYLHAKNCWIRWHQVTPPSVIYAHPQCASSPVCCLLSSSSPIGWLRVTPSPVEYQQTRGKHSPLPYDPIILRFDYLPFYSEDEIISSDVSDSGRGISDTEEDINNDNDDGTIVVLNNTR